MNVGVSIKNIGTYLKSSLGRSISGSTEGNLKNFNNLNLKQSSQNYKINTSPSSQVAMHQNGNNADRRHSTTLIHRHSNPAGSLTNLSSSIAASNTNGTAAATLRRHQTTVLSSSPSSTSAATTAATDAALPRIKINT